eukprot:jgi/Chlat1/7329/Chrsp59S06964
MPPLALPYKRPFFTLALQAHEIEEDLAVIISNTKRRRRTSPPTSAPRKTQQAGEGKNGREHIVF